MPVSCLRARASTPRSKISCHAKFWRFVTIHELIHTWTHAISIATDFVVTSAVTKVFLLVFYRTMKPECFFWMNNSSRIVCFDASVLVMWLRGYRSILCLCDGLFCDAFSMSHWCRSTLKCLIYWVTCVGCTTKICLRCHCKTVSNKPLAVPTRVWPLRVPLKWVAIHSAPLLTYLSSELICMSAKM